MFQLLVKQEQVGYGAMRNTVGFILLFIFFASTGLLAIDGLAIDCIKASKPQLCLFTK